MHIIMDGDTTRQLENITALLEKILKELEKQNN